MKHLLPAAALALVAGILLGAAPAVSTATAPATTTTRALAPITQPTAGGVIWLAHHDRLVERAKQGDIDLYLEGDSITDLWTTTGKAVYEKELGGWKTADFGISGDTCQNVLYRLTHGELDGCKPKVFMLMVGTNNTTGYTAEQIAEGVTAIVNVMKEKQPQAKILLLAIFPRGANDDDTRRQKTVAVNKIIAKLDDGKTVKFLNINDKFLAPDGKLIGFNNDNLHPSAQGYQLWADAVKAQLTEWLGPPAPTATTAATSAVK